MSARKSGKTANTHDDAFTVHVTLLPAGLPLPSSVQRHLHVRAFVAVALCVGLGGGCADVRPDLKLVEHIVFEGHERASVAGLRHLADVPNGVRIWEVDSDAVVAGVSRHPWVAHATAQVEWPDTIRVRVFEHHPVALLAYHGEESGDRSGLFYVDADGNAFLEANSSDLDYPVLTGVGSSMQRAHPRLPGLVVRDALWLREELVRRDLVSERAISEIAVDVRHGFSVSLIGGARVAFAFSDLEAQVDRLQVLVAQEGLGLDRPVLVDVAPATVAIVRALDLPAASLTAPADVRPLVSLAPTEATRPGSAARLPPSG